MEQKHQHKSKKRFDVWAVSNVDNSFDMVVSENSERKGIMSGKVVPSNAEWCYDQTVQSKMSVQGQGRDGKDREVFKKEKDPRARRDER